MALPKPTALVSAVSAVRHTRSESGPKARASPLTVHWALLLTCNHVLLLSPSKAESARFIRDSGVADRLLYGSALFEHIASGVLQGAVRASVEKEEKNRAFNPWRTGKDPVDPTVARDFFAQTSLHHAADYDLKVFISNPFLYAHMQNLFYPAPPASSSSAVFTLRRTAQ